MGFLNMGELDRAKAQAPRRPYGPMRYVGPPPGAMAQREGAPLVPAPARRTPVQARPAFDRSQPTLPVANWTPWGWQSPVPGRSMESF